jgi:serine/threonine-protein kinase
MGVNLRKIPGYGAFASIEPILRGCSGEDKYRVTIADGEKRFLRVGVCGNSLRNHEMHLRAEALGITIAKTIDFGLFPGGKRYYWLLTWLEGANACDVLPTLGTAGQYGLGAKSGGLLREIHSLPVREEMENAYDWRGRNIAYFYGERKKKYGGRSELYDNIAAYIERNKNILKTRPQVFMHGDFGLSNLIVTPGGEVAPTDFSYNFRSYGDPCGEISNFCERGATAPYMSGQINGYFAGEIPGDFWRAYLFFEAYVALIILSTRETQAWVDFLETWYRERVEKPEGVVPKWFMTS